MAVMPSAQLQRQRAGRHQPPRAVALGLAEQAEADAVAVLGVAEPLQHLGHELTRVRTEAAAPVDESLVRPLLVCAMGRGHVRVHRGDPAAARAADVAGAAAARPGYFAMTDLEMPRLRAMASCGSAALYLSLRRSLVMRMSVRRCSIGAPAKKP